MIKILLIQATLVASLLFGLEATEQETVALVQNIIASSHTSRAMEVWPGFDLSVSPILATFKNGHVYAFHLKSTDTAWKTQEGRLYSAQDHWGVTPMAMNHAFPIEGQSAYVFNFDTSFPDKQKPFEVFIHERFHTFQATRFAQNAPKGHYVDHLNVENLTLMQLEEHILSLFLRQPSEEYLRNYLAIHQMRETLIAPSSVLWEDHQQTVEGLADYVSIRFFDVFNHFPEYSGRNKLAFLLHLYAGDPNISERALKWRHYGVGAALGYALDFLQVKDWKQRVEHGESLNSILRQALPIAPSELRERFDYMAVAFHFNMGLEHVGTTVTQFVAELNRIKTSYQTLNGISLQIGHPSNTSISGGGTTARTLYLEDGSTISLQDSSQMATQENAWMMQTRVVPYLFQTAEGLRELKVEPDVNVYIDGETYSLQKLVQNKATKSFTTLSYEGQSSRFITERTPGKLAVLPNGKVRITFD